MWKILLELPASIQFSVMFLSFFVGLGHIVIPFFILMNFVHAAYLFFTPWKPNKDD